MKKRISTSQIVAITLTPLLLLASSVYAQSPTTITYQGELQQNGNLANGSYNMVFQLWNLFSGGTQLDSMTINGVQVVDGRFTAELDFGSANFNLWNQNRWLQIQVNGNTLSPRSLISRSPYSLQTRGIRVNEDASFVGVGRDTRLTSAEIFGLYRSTADFAGMYIETENNGKPFYGYSTAGSVDAYHYYDDASGTWRLNAGGADRMIVDSGSGNTEIGGKLSVGGGSTFGQVRILDTSPGAAIGLDVENTNEGFPTILAENAAGGPVIWVYGTDDVTPAGGGLIVVGSEAGRNIAIDGNEIMARNNGQAAQLNLNGEGGANILAGGPGSKLITPVLQITGGSDFSEMFDVGGEVKPQTGMVVVIDPNHPGRLIPSTQAYDRKVAGIISGAGGVATGMMMGHSGTIADGQHPVALSGRVYCLVDASDCEISPGDLMTTSSTVGHAMKAIDSARASGAILGKAMTPLAKGETGLVLVLVNLQ